MRKTYQVQQARVEARARELGIPERFHPCLQTPGWHYGGHHLFEDLRTEMRRVAYLQIYTLIKADLEDLERESSRIVLEILSQGMLTEEAKAFFDRLPRVEELLPPLEFEQITALMEGQRIPTRSNRLLEKEICRQRPQDREEAS